MNQIELFVTLHENLTAQDGNGAEIAARATITMSSPDVCMIRVSESLSERQHKKILRTAERFICCLLDTELKEMARTGQILCLPFSPPPKPKPKLIKSV